MAMPGMGGISLFGSGDGKDLAELAVDAVGIFFAPETGGLSLAAAGVINNEIGQPDQNSVLGDATSLANDYTSEGFGGL